MKFPEDVRKLLQQRYRSKHRDWLGANGTHRDSTTTPWPMVVKLGIPTEQQAAKQVEDVRSWVAAWQSWRGTGALRWIERRWKTLGTQHLPESLVLDNPLEVALWLGESERWKRAHMRYQELIIRWPALAGRLARYYELLADYCNADYQRMVSLLAWIEQHPTSNLYPRQLPVSGLDTKWMESRKTVIANLVAVLRGQPTTGNLFEACGLRALPQLVRIRLLDDSLRKSTGGLTDIIAPRAQVAALDLRPSHVFIVENLQTALAFDELPGAMVIMQLGYGVDVLGQLPWLRDAHCIYWGDLDTHGFAILHRARHYLPELQSVLMDEETLRENSELWVEEKEQHGAETLSLLTASEAVVYEGIKRNTWGQNVRLEQERIDWATAWSTIKSAILPKG